VPYTLATVELKEGCRNRRAAAGRAGFGKPASAVFFDHEDWTELRFAA